MSDELLKLTVKARKGSKPRCHWLTHGDRELVARRLSELVGSRGSVTKEDRWLPIGFENIDEPQLDKSELVLPCREDRDALFNWWISIGKRKATTPNFDIASTCRIGNDRGFILVEAKAHTDELKKELAPRKLTSNSPEAIRNHIRITGCIREASHGLMAATDLRWAISHEWCYQMSNRFAWAWKLTELGYSVVLIYLGFLNANEMGKGKNDLPFDSPEVWRRCVLEHSRILFPEKVWESDIKINKHKLIPLIRSCEISYTEEIREPLDVH